MSRTCNVGDPVTGKTRLLSRLCDTCILNPAATRIALPRGRIAQLIRDTRRAESFVVCHSTTFTTGVRPAVCRGFYDRYKTAALQIIARLWGFIEVDPPRPQRREDTMTTNTTDADNHPRRHTRTAPNGSVLSQEPEPLPFAQTGQIVLWCGTVVPTDWWGVELGGEEEEPVSVWRLNLWAPGEIDATGPIPWTDEYGPDQLVQAQNWAAALVASNTDLVVKAWTVDPDGGDCTAVLAGRVHRLRITTVADSFTVDLTPQYAQAIISQARLRTTEDYRRSDGHLSSLVFDLPTDNDRNASPFEVARTRTVWLAQLVDIEEVVLEVPYAGGASVRPRPYGRALKVE